MNLTDYLFNTPWWLPAILLVVGAVVFYVANGRLDRRNRTIGMVILSLGVGIGVVSYFVETDLEKAETHTKNVVSAVDRQDWDALRTLLDRNTSVGIANAVTLYRGPDQVAGKAKEASEKYGFKSVNVTGMTSHQDQTLITIGIGVVSVQDAVGAPITSRWEFDYLQASDGWFLNEIRAIEIGRSQGEQMEHMFRGGKGGRVQNDG